MEGEEAARQQAKKGQAIWTRSPSSCFFMLEMALNSVLLLLLGSQGCRPEMGEWKGVEEGRPEGRREGGIWTERKKIRKNWGGRNGNSQEEEGD
jgi:hypothetical protein